MAPLPPFAHSLDPEPHGARTRAILRAHPEIRGLIGKNPWSFPIILALVGAQLALAVALEDAPWWVVLLVAYGVGALLDHALWVMIHEAAHNLVFRRPAWNYLAGIVANLPQVIPSAVSFKRYHLKHHSFQGVYELDADIPSEWEARLVGTSPVRKALWLALFPLVQMTRPLRIRQVPIVDAWVLLNGIAVIGLDVLVVAVLGWTSLLYLLASLFFSIGLHPLGARWIQRHFLVAPTQETYSYYGPLNRLAFNVGYHNEHHDFPSVPWSRLPRVKAVGTEWYEGLTSHPSWSRLLVRFILDPTLTLHSRMLREERGGRRLDDDAAPDLAEGAPGS